MNVRSLIFGLLVLSVSCKKDKTACPSQDAILDELNDGKDTYVLTTSGEIYIRKNDGCEFFMQYFDKDFLSKNYYFGDAIYTYSDDRQLIKTRNHICDSFSTYTKFTDLFVTSAADTFKLWYDFVLQSPAKPTVADYVQLRKCIMAQSCSFIDNRIDVADDPAGNFGKCMKCIAYAPTASMVCSKSSFETTILFADKGDEISYEADYYVDEGMPTTLVDFENKWFSEAPGIRLIFDQSQYLSAELKYGTKPYYRQDEAARISFPKKQWVHVKAYFLLDEGSNGIVRVWQDGVKIIDTTGKTLPTSNSVQTNMEVGISATNVYTVMYMDNLLLDIVHN